MATDWCLKAEQFRAAREKLILGQAAVEVAFGEDRVRFGRADMERLDSLITQAERECAIQNGETPKRRRYAMRARFRSY